MSEEKVRKLSMEMVSKQLHQAKLKRMKGSQSRIVQLDADIMNLKREINWEIRLLSEEVFHELDVETDDTQRNR